MDYVHDFNDVLALRFPPSDGSDDQYPPHLRDHTSLSRAILKMMMTRTRTMRSRILTASPDDRCTRYFPCFYL